MTANPYDNLDFARLYARSQVDRSRNLYEFEVTHPSTLQFLDESVDRVLDYGCGAGVFTASMARLGRTNINPNLEIVGTDASEQMLGFTSFLTGKVEGLSFERWNASVEDSNLQKQAFGRIFAKLVFNYITPSDLEKKVFPRLHELLRNDGLMIAVLPNPLREVDYSRQEYTERTAQSINVGNFNVSNEIQSYHHTYESLMTSAANAGFTYARALGLPEVRFESYKKGLMPIAHPMPMIFDTLNAAKRWVYVFGASEASADSFDRSVSRFETWRAYCYPEIADRAHFRVDTDLGSDTAIPVKVPHDSLYDYVDISNGATYSVNGRFAENLTPQQKVRLSKRLAKMGIRETVDYRYWTTST